jgi:hypothetical protein
MKSPKPATDNRFKKLIKSYLWNRTMLNFCDIVVAILKMQTGRNCSMSGINSGRWNRTMLNLCGIVVAILKMVTGRKFSMLGINSGHHYLATYQILMISGNVEFFIPCFGSHFENGRYLENFEMQNCSSNGDLSLCQILCLYHYSFRSYQH